MKKGSKTLILAIVTFITLTGGILFYGCDKKAEAKKELETALNNGDMEQIDTSNLEDSKTSDEVVTNETETNDKNKKKIEETKTEEKSVPYEARDIICPMNNNSVHRMSSDHFQIIWGNGDKTGMVNEEFVKGNLENLENIRSFYVNELKMADTGSLPQKGSKKYKTNLYIAETGVPNITDNWAYMAVDAEGYGYMVMMPKAMRVDEPSWVIPHEYAHAITHHQGGVMPDRQSWYEPIANWYRDQFLGSKYYKHGNKVYGPASDFFKPLVLNSDCYFPHQKNYYDAWPIFLYISENPDKIDGLGKDAMLKIISDKTANEDMFTRISRITGVSIKDILGNYARRMVTMDFERQNCYLKYLNDTLKEDATNSQKIYTTLNKNGEWLEVPNDRAPM